jgi:hypothetical protein
MGKRKLIIALIVPGLVAMLALSWWIPGGERKQEHSSNHKGCVIEDENLMTGSLHLGGIPGRVVYDEGERLYYLEVKGARFPFMSSPLAALDVPLEARGKTRLEKNTSLIYGILGRDVLHTTVLVNPEEEQDVMPAVTDIARAIQIVNKKKFAGVAYTGPGGKLARSVVRGSPVQNIEDATSRTPLVQLKGPKSGGSETRVQVGEGGKVVVEGKDYESLTRAADYMYLTLLQMLCGSSECPDASGCLTGGDCGCG